MVNFLLGQQGGYNKYPCFVCLWDSRARKDHWINKVWPLRTDLTVEEANILYELLVPREKIILPPLHIKLGLMKQFVKSLDKDGPCFKYICRSFSGMSNEKLKAGIFDGPQIRILIRNSGFVQSMTNLESSARCAFVLIINNFLGNLKLTTT
ncbi:hypothetical protein LOD99_7686 [Oopsacas minuta]|uniref:Uncharacterized protein n=1 Tax=Oopsacas minuta TaxID=111878 RepID=A0AAV7JQN0_9METZ|nr:hypothetical protein LOD99_7686 [Oopsacas minuta]